MPDLENLFARIDAEKREFNQTVWPPVSASAIERLAAFARDPLRAELPPGYITFLRWNDALDFNSFAILTRVPTLACEA